jgi:hypothetical protein
MSRRTVKVVVTTAALALSGSVGLWTATAAPADEVPPAVVEPVTPEPSPSATAPPANPQPPAKAGGYHCALCLVPTD